MDATAEAEVDRLRSASYADRDNNFGSQGGVSSSARRASFAALRARRLGFVVGPAAGASATVAEDPLCLASEASSFSSSIAAVSAGDALDTAIGTAVDPADSLSGTAVFDSDRVSAGA
jgi:hypothetical protein